MARRKRYPNIQTWYRRNDRTWYWLAEKSGVSLRTVMRIASGFPCHLSTAEALNKVTGVPEKVLMRGHR